MLEKWENVKGTIKTMGKELSAAFDWAFDRLFSKIQLTNEQFVYVLLSVVFIVANAILWVQKFQGFPITATERPEVVYKAKTPADQIPHTARIMANGDQLYHDLVYMSAQKEDGTYDFHENYEYVKPWLQKADLALGDFEGTINPDYPLSGYPLFNAPQSVTAAIKDAGYDVMDLAHNHILDSGLEGAFTTADAFKEVGIDPVGVYEKPVRDKAPLLIKNVNGIKVAILSYAYGYNGLESNLTDKEVADHLSNLDEKRMKAEIQRAEKEADITVIMPQMGVEYRLEPTDEQVKLYHKMIDWGADIIFGGHPHVVEPSEVVKKDGQQKLIIYSMGNFISNQRIETMDGVDSAEWTERGVLMDVTLEKKNGQTTIKTAQAHPTWVNRTPKGTTSPEGYPLYTYQTYILEDFIKGGKYRNKLDEETKERIDTAYKEMNAHVNLKWK